MGLADQALDIIAFCCARHHSDHHVIAFAKSTRIGFHHASFQLTDPDAVGRAGLALRGKSDGGDWGFGRHTIGSNFFHYIQDPWGSWFEYYSDMDFIDDYNVWTPTNYEMEDSLGRVDKRDSQAARFLIHGFFLRSSHGSRGFVGCGMERDRAAAAV